MFHRSTDEVATRAWDITVKEVGDLMTIDDPNKFWSKYRQILKELTSN